MGSVLPIAPSTYYRAQALSDNPHKRSLHSQHDAYYIGEIKRIWRDSKGRYGARKVWQQMLNWQPLNGWIGLTKPVCLVKLVMCRLLSLKSGIMII